MPIVAAPEDGVVGTVAALLRRRSARLDLEESRERGDGDPFLWQRRYSWAELMKRVFLVDVLTCPDCGGPRRLLAFILNPSAIERILRHLRLPTEPPTVYPARASPEQEEFGFAE